jgi:CTP:molybdopterin cytidylyltransferase MocA
VLAAGAGSRFAAGPDAGHKLLAEWRGHPLAWWSVANALGAGLDRTCVVVGAVDLTGIMPEGAEIVGNPRWPDGQATSLQVALDWARRTGADAMVVGLADQPSISPEAWRAVAGADSPIAVANYRGNRRNPVKLTSQVWDLLPESGDEGARSVIRSNPGLVRDVPCEGDPTDIDTREDLEAWI